MYIARWQHSDIKGTCQMIIPFRQILMQNPFFEGLNIVTSKYLIGDLNSEFCLFLASKWLMFFMIMNTYNEFESY